MHVFMVTKIKQQQLLLALYASPPSSSSSSTSIEALRLLFELIVFL